MRVGALVPHAPVLVPLLESAETAAAGAELRTALRKIDLHDVDLIVIVSPHGSRTGVYRSPRGDLRDFGVPGVHEERHTDPRVAADLAHAWGAPLLDAPADHGIVVPLALGFVPDVAVVAATFAESEPDTAAAERFAAAVAAIASTRPIALLASANTSAALSPRAPLTERPEALAVEAELLAGIAEDCSAARELAPAMTTAGGSCAAGPLTVLGTLFAGHRAEVLAHEAPLGVGYLVAAV